MISLAFNLLLFAFNISKPNAMLDGSGGCGAGGFCWDIGGCWCLFGCDVVVVCVIVGSSVDGNGLVISIKR